MKPLIGVASSYNWKESLVTLDSVYYLPLARSGAVPVVIPPYRDMDSIVEVVSHIDGLLLTGGVDVDPLCYGQQPIPALGEVSPERDFSEINLFKAAIEKGIPILGICRGCQVMAAAADGTLCQDIYQEYGSGAIKHGQNAPYWHPTHRVSIVTKTKLHDIIGKVDLGVNSLHHQSVKDIPKGYIINALAPDGVIEGIESTSHNFVLGVQWHPEKMWEKCQDSLKIFEAFINAASRR